MPATVVSRAAAREPSRVLLREGVPIVGPAGDNSAALAAAVAADEAADAANEQTALAEAATAVALAAAGTSFRTIDGDVEAGVYTALLSDEAKTLRYTAADDIEFECPASFPEGWWARVKVVGIGMITFTAGSGATVRNEVDAFQTSRQGSQCQIEVDGNTDDASAVWDISGGVGE